MRKALYTETAASPMMTMTHMCVHACERTHMGGLVNVYVSIHSC